MNRCRTFVTHVIILVPLLFAAACSVPAVSTTQATDEHNADHHAEEALPELSAPTLSEGELLQVVATTSIVADIVAEVGSEQIVLTQLFPPGADAHSYVATPQDVVAMNEAHVIFINGLGLEESLGSVLEGLDGVSIVPVNAGVEPAGYDHGHEHDEDSHDEDSHEDSHDEEEGHREDADHAEHGEHAHDEGDPHTWFSIRAVEQWVDNIEQTLSELDPANADIYAANASAYLEELERLEADIDELLAALPVEKRKLVTDHESLGYLAAEYDFEIVGTVIPSLSTVASPSAQELAALQDQIVAEGVQAIFVGVSANPTVAEQIAGDTGVQVVPIYVESLSDPGGPASTYLDFMRHTLATIVNALKG